MSLVLGSQDFGDSAGRRDGDRQPHARLLLRPGRDLPDEAARWTAVDRAVAEGADIVDIGGVKAGLGPEVDAAEEIDGVLPSFVGGSAATIPDLVISVDTWRAQVGRGVLQRGRRPDQRHLGRRRPGAGRGGRGVRRRARLCSHTGGAAPRTDPHRVAYDDVVADVIDDGRRGADAPSALGVRRDAILIDPTHDFGKNTYHSLELTRRLDELVATGWPVLVALSNKDFIGETLDLDVAERRERHAGGDRGLGLARRPGVPGAPGAGRPGRCSTWWPRSRDRPPARALRGRPRRCRLRMTARSRSAA